MSRAPSPARQGPGALPEHVVRRLTLRLRRTARGRLAGEQQTRGAAADGMELAQLVAYVPGDDVRRLDPAASARTGEPHVRRLVPERALTTWIVADVSPSMAFGSARRLKSDVVEGAAEALARTATRHGGKVALALAGGLEAPVLPPASGREALAGVRRALRAGVEPDGTPGDLGRALERVGRLAREAGTLVVLSDLREEGWARPLRALAARHSTVVVEVRDPLEDELPDAGLVTFADPETGALVDVDTSDPRVRAAAAAAEAERAAAVAATLRGAGAEHVRLTTDGDWLRDLGRVLR